MIWSTTVAFAQDVVESADHTPVPAGPKSPVLIISLQQALHLAFTQGRDKQTQDEELRLLDLSLHTTRLDYGPIPTDTLSVVKSGGGQARLPATTTESATIGVTQALPTGGTATLSSSTSMVHAAGASPQKSTTDAVSLHQPLLRGAGILVWRENLTNAERAYLYARRANIQYRQDLAISTASMFWGLQGQRNSVDQAVDAVARAQFLLDQSRALMSVDKSDANDVFRAETALLSTRQSQVDSEAAYAAAIENFKLILAIPTEQRIALDTSLPTGPRLHVDPEQAIAEAAKNRLDLQSYADQVQDADRELRLSRRALLPELDLDASLSYGGGSNSSWSAAAAGPPVYSVGVSLQVPLVQYDQRLAYQRALIGRLQTSRSFEQARQQVILQVLNTLNTLRQAEASLVIQERTRVQTRQRAEKAELDFNAGLIPNRDLLEAQEEVRVSENAWFSALVAYRTAELQLRRDTGVMQVSADGMWSDKVPSYAQILPDIPTPGNLLAP